MLYVNSQLQIPLREFEITFSRSSGPGGQNVNKVNSKASLRWKVVTSPALPEAVRQRLLAKQRPRITAEGDLLLTSQRFRDAGRNAADCLEKLRRMLDEASQLPPRAEAHAAHARLRTAPRRCETAAIAEEAATPGGRPGRFVSTTPTATENDAVEWGHA